MKTGDIVYCKKTNDTNSECKRYKISSISINEIDVSVNPGCKTEDDEHNEIIGRSYYINNPIQNYSKFDEYFMDEKEIRKSKLKKINERR